MRSTRLMILSGNGKRRGYSLIEVLLVLSIVSFLASILTPAFLAARANARKLACLSNMRQIGISIAVYSQDYDDLYPMGADPVDKHTNLWDEQPDFSRVIRTAPLLQDVLDSYVRDKRVWCCPSDTGYDALDTNRHNDKPLVLSAHPTSYDAFGTSYLYRTELALKRIQYGSSAYDLLPPWTEHSTAELSILTDSMGSWHGGTHDSRKRLNTLMGDGHVENQSAEQHRRSWSLQVEPSMFLPGWE